MFGVKTTTDGLTRLNSIAERHDTASLAESVLSSLESGGEHYVISVDVPLGDVDLDWHLVLADVGEEKRASVILALPAGSVEEVEAVSDLVKVHASTYLYGCNLASMYLMAEAGLDYGV
jgi:hypothetical protein